MLHENHGDNRAGSKKFQANSTRNNTQMFRQARTDTVSRQHKPKLESNSNYTQVMKELDTVRQELSKLKQDMASILHENKTVEIENTEAASMSSYLIAKDESCKNNKQNMIQEEGETSLAIVVSNVRTLESEIYKKIDKEQESNESQLESTKRDLSATVKELASIIDEASQFRVSMDIIQDELLHVKKETQIFKKREDKANMMINNLNSSLAKAKAKMETTSTAAEKAKSTPMNLTNTLEELKSADQELLSIHDENAFTKEEIHKTEADIKLVEEKLQNATQELDNIKSSEAMAVENLKDLIENTKRRQNSGARGNNNNNNNNNNMIISKAEYEYMKGNASGIVEVAEKRVRAMKAWVEAMRASEKEIVLNGELLRRGSREKERMRVEKKGRWNGGERRVV